MKPFRWSIQRREQLGSLIDDVPNQDLARDGLLSEIREASARVIGFSDGADLAFIGRTPENFFDYLSGILCDIEDAPALHLIQFSLRWAGTEGVRAIEPEKLVAFFEYLTEERVDAASIATGKRPLALVDFVAYGGTMQNVVELLHLNAERSGTDWNAVQRRLKIIGLRVRTHNSPNTWRWQQHQDWLDLIPQATIKNVSAPGHLLWYLANDQPKLTRPFHPGLWDRMESAGSYITEHRKKALGLAVQLFDAGRSKGERDKLARAIAQMPEMKQPATRNLVSRMKR